MCVCVSVCVCVCVSVMKKDVEGERKSREVKTDQAEKQTVFRNWN